MRLYESSLLRIKACLVADIHDSSSRYNQMRAKKDAERLVHIIPAAPAGERTETILVRVLPSPAHHPSRSCGV
jgi:hypothetical protein